MSDTPSNTIRKAVRKFIYLFIALFLFPTMVNAEPRFVGGSTISDAAYDATTWDGVADIAPSKNALRDKIEAIVVGAGLINDGAYPTDWDGDTTYAASRNALYDYLETICLESVFGTAIGTGLLLDSTTLKTSAILQKYHAIDPADDVELLLACATEAAIRTFLDLEPGTDFYSKSAEDTWRAGVTQTEMGYVDGITSDIQDQIDLKAPLTSPTFVTSITMGSAGLTEPELQILDGATLTTTQLNYLNGATGVTGTASVVLSTSPTFVTSIIMGNATLSEAELEILDGATLDTTQINYLASAGGTTGTTSTNLVFSTSPVFITPTLGAATATSITIDAAANPVWTWRDADGGDTDKSAGDMGAGFSTTTANSEISDWHIGSLGAGVAGTHHTNLFFRSSTASLYMGVLENYTGANPSVVPLDTATFESLMWDFDYATDTVGVSSPVSATTTIDFTTLNLLTTGSLAGRPIITTADARVLTAAELSGGVVLVTTASEVSLPDVCDSATGAAVLIVQRDASEKVEIGVTDTSDDMTLDGTALGANQEIDSPGGAGDAYAYICMVCVSANMWANFGRSGTWVDGGAAQ